MEAIYKNEKLLLLIPIHNFKKGVQRLEEFARNNLSKLFDDWEICLINNNSNRETTDFINNLSKKSNISSVTSTKQKSLKDSIYKGFSNRFKSTAPNKPTIIAIWETDAVPNLSTFSLMIKAFIKYRSLNIKIASISPMYTWNNKFCYPTHNHWHTDKVYDTDIELGTITTVHAIPFLFSIWSPQTILRINNKTFRDFIGLDTDFGKHLSALGYKHLRLINHSIDHENGGKNSH